jgi:ribonuclease HI
MISVKTVEIYTDGACSGNPGPGGYGAVLIYGGARKELSGGCVSTTNNRMELMAAIMALEALKEPCEVKLYSDSKYLVDGVSKGWAVKWRRDGWMRTKKDPALNPDLWERLLGLLSLHTVDLRWVRGHADNPENNRCDQLAREGVLATKNAKNTKKDV